LALTVICPPKQRPTDYRCEIWSNYSVNLEVERDMDENGVEEWEDSNKRPSGEDPSGCKMS